MNNKTQSAAALQLAATPSAAALQVQSEQQNVKRDIMEEKTELTAALVPDQPDQPDQPNEFFKNFNDLYFFSEDTKIQNSGINSDTNPSYNLKTNSEKNLKKYLQEKNIEIFTCSLDSVATQVPVATQDPTVANVIETTATLAQVVKQQIYCVKKKELEKEGTDINTTVFEIEISTNNNKANTIKGNENI